MAALASLGSAVVAAASEYGSGADRLVAAETEAEVAQAEQGDAKAQYNLGLMYAKGEDVAKDDCRAAL